MKTYANGKQSTEFTKKQIGVIYYKAKAGELKVEKWIISELYDLADYYDIDFNHNVQNSETKVLRILDDVFAGNLEDAQAKIDAFTEDLYHRLGQKRQKNIDRRTVA